jgi:nucleoside-diphosphate-sugar epimerase
VYHLAARTGAARSLAEPMADAETNVLGALQVRIMARTVEVPGLVTVVATVLGGALLGIIGALIAIPVAAAIKLLIEEVAAPSLDKR